MRIAGTGTTPTKPAGNVLNVDGRIIVVDEVWRIIPEFPDYEASNFGQIANREGDYLIRPSTTMQGALKVGLVKNQRQCTRSVKRIIAQLFVPGQDDIFDTPIQLDCDQTNCRADNLEWRPRWFAWHYHQQYGLLESRFRLGPIVELDESGAVIQAYTDLVDAAKTNGLLLDHLWKGVNLREPVFPNNQFFAFANKV